MKKLNLLFVGVLALSATAIFFINKKTSELKPLYTERVSSFDGADNDLGKSLEPHDQWLSIRSYPNGFDQELYLDRMIEIQEQARYVGDSREVDLTIDWLQEGPGNIGGRVNVLTLDPTDNDIVYAGSNNGGVFKTIDGGETWIPIFDDYAFLAIGSITIDPEDANTIYIGTGDKNFGGGSYIGNGVYKSVDAGLTWNESGLEETGVITELIIDPTDSDRIFASTMGNPFVKNGQRGVYRSDNGGASWSNKLFLADSAGVIDLVMDPSNPNVLYATGYNRMRSYSASTVRGPQARIFKTINGGDSWTMLSSGLPMDDDDSRIGLAISNVDPSILYALYVDGYNLDIDDVYKTTNSGASWFPLNVHDGADDIPNSALGGFGWYFGEIFINPYNNDQIIVPGVEMHHSLDAGENWTMNVPDWWTYEVHADKHAIAFLDEDSYILATDGGLYKTDDNGDNWEDIDNIPITQFYHIDVHPHEDGLYGGGAQDNGSMSGNAASFNDWERLNGGDGFRVVFLEDDAGAAYYETQNGGLRYKDAGGSTTNVSPDDPGDDRTNWDMPYHINENAAELFVGTAHIQLMEGAPYGGYSYISDDLTRVGLGDYEGTARYHTITEMDQPHNDGDLLYVGTSDGLVWRGERSGSDWDWINCTADLPNRYVTGIRCSPNNAGTVYVTFSGYKVDSDLAYVYKSTDFGATWTDISSNLPSVTVNDVLIVPGYDEDEYLFTALDGGVYFSSNNGGNWDYVGVGLPLATISELHLDIDNEKLIAGTYARSMWSYDVSWMDDIEEPIDDTGIEDLENIKLNIYPNPAKDYIYFDVVEVDEIQLYDQQGKFVLTQKVHHLNGYSKVNLEILKTGIYYFKVGNSTGTIIIK